MDTSKTILVIEDDPGQQKIYSIALQKAGYKVVVRSEAISGLRWLEQILPDLILLDIMLPGISGIDMLHKIRNSPNGREVPVIIATASSEVQREDFTGYDISALLQKPVLPSDLLKVIGATLAVTNGN